MNSKMLTSCFTLCIVIFLSCSTPDSRIRKNQELFDTYPPDVQDSIREGKVKIGFTEDMVRMALGNPNETAVNVTKEGEVHVWAYTKSTTGGGVSVGRSSLGRTRVGVGVSMGRAPQKKYTAIVEFGNGRVSKVTYFDN